MRDVDVRTTLRSIIVCMLRAVLTTLVVVAMMPATPALAVNYGRDWGTNWNRYPWYDLTFLQSAQRAAEQQAGRSPNYDTAYGSNIMANSVVYWMRKADAVAISLDSHALADTSLNASWITFVNDANQVSCLATKSLGSPHWHLVGDYGGQGLCQLPKLTSELQGVSDGAQIVMLTACQTAANDGANSKGLATRVYYDLDPALVVYGFTGFIGTQDDGNGNDIIGRRWEYVFWQDMAASHSVAYAQSDAKGSIFDTFSGYYAYDTGTYMGSGDYKLPY